MTGVKKAAAVSILRFSIPRDATSPAVARRQISRFATEHRVDDPETLLLVASELVTNAVVHGAEPIEVSIDLDDRRLRVEVSDSSADTSAVAERERTPDRPGGWGLQIVGSLTQRWGTDRHAAGKTVWVEIDCAGAGESPSSEAHG